MRPPKRPTPTARTKRKAAILAALLVLEVAFFCCLLNAPTDPGPFNEVLMLRRQVRDRDLLTEEEKEMARESGVGSYTINGVHYVDYTLPSEYWD